MIAALRTDHLRLKISCMTAVLRKEAIRNAAGVGVSQVMPRALMSHDLTNIQPSPLLHSEPLSLHHSIRAFLISLLVTGLFLFSLCCEIMFHGYAPNPSQDQ